MKNSNFPFNVRVYGLFLKEGNVLVVDESRNGFTFTKFPGGGLEFGESTIECLQRECREEMEREIEVGDHFYTTDQFVPSAFNAKHQVISIYYFATMEQACEVTTTPFDFTFEEGTDKWAFRWCNLQTLAPNDLYFPIDKIVLEKLKQWPT